MNEPGEHVNGDGYVEACDACNELSAALGWPTGISGGPLQWSDLLRRVAELRRQHRGGDHAATGAGANAP